MPVSIAVAGSIEMNLLAKYLYETFEPASFGVLQGLTDIVNGLPFCDKFGNDYFKQFESLQIPLLVICADQDDLVSIENSLRCFENSSSKDKAKLVYVADVSETLSYGHCDLLIGKHAATHVWEKIRIWLDQRRKLGMELSEDTPEDSSYYLPEAVSSDLLLPESSSSLLKEGFLGKMTLPTGHF